MRALCMLAATLLTACILVFASRPPLPAQVTSQGDPERLRLGHTDAERDRIGQYASENARAITELLARVPRPLLLLLKTNDCLR
jgi:hypothetical protein